MYINLETRTPINQECDVPLKKPTFKYIKPIACFLVVAYSNSALAQAQAQASSPNEISNVYACRDISDAELRLECYDTAVGRLEDAQKSGSIVAIGKKELETIEKESFGFNIPSLPKLTKLFGGTKDKASVESTKPFKKSDLNSDQSNIVLEISKVKEFGYKKFRFYFKNGQVWEQVGTGKIRVGKKNPGNAHIRKASLGSYLLRVNGSGTAISVRRVR